MPMIRVSSCGGLALVAACGAPCGPTVGVVERVIDGDTIVLTTGEEIRYLLIDTPEISDGHQACYGANAAQLNADLVLGQRVELQYDLDCTDRFGRLLAYVTVAGVDVNRLMVERGYACVLHIAPDGNDRAAEFQALEAQARAARRGLWGDCTPIPCKSRI